MLGAEVARERQPLGHDVDGDDARAHRAAEHGCAEPHRTLAEDRQRVATRDVDALERAVGGAGSTRDGRALFERQLLRKRHAGERGRLHVSRVPTVTGHPIDGDPRAAELRPAEAAMAARAAALVVVIHHAPADQRRIHADAHCGDDATRLVTRNDGTAAAEAEGGGGIAGRAIGMQIAAAHPGGLHLEHDLAGSWRRIGKFLDFELAIAEEYDAPHGQPPWDLRLDLITASL